jgi:hypothetical protein
MRGRRNKSGERTRESYLPDFICALLCLFFAAFMVYFVDPSTFLAVPFFFGAVFLMFYFLFLILFKNNKEALVFSGFILIFLALRYFKIGNLINFLLLIGIAITIFFYDKITKNERDSEKTA